MPDVNLGTAHGRISIDSSSLKTLAATTQSAMSKVLAGVTSVGKSMQSVGKSMTTYITLPIIGLGVLAVKAWTEQAAATANAQAVIKSTGGIANVTASQMGKLSNSVRDYSGQSDESVLNGEAMLATFVNIRNEVGKGNDMFNQATVALADLTAKFGGDASTNAIRLGKALNDPILGMTALRRVGIQYTAEEQARIKKDMANNDILGAQKVIMSELTKQFGGLARAQGQTDAGKLKIAWGQFGDVMEHLGAVILPMVVAAAKGLLAFANWIMGLPGPVKLAIAAFVLFLAVLGPILFIFGGLISKITTVVKIFQFLRLAMATAAGAESALTVSSSLLTASEERAAIATGLLGAAFKAAFPEIALVVGIIAGAVAIWHSITAANAANKKAIDSMTTSLVKNGAAWGAHTQVMLDAKRVELQQQFGMDQGNAIADALQNQLDTAQRYAEMLREFVLPGASANQIGAVAEAVTSGHIQMADALKVADSAAKDGSISQAHYTSLLEALGFTLPEVTRRYNTLGVAAAATAPKFGKAGAAVQHFNHMTDAAFADWKTTTIANLHAASPALDALANKAKLTGSSVVRAFQKQAKEFVSYSKNLQRVINSNLPDALKQQIIDMGVAGAPVVSRFANMTKGELAKVGTAFNKGQNAVDNINFGPLTNATDSSKGKVDALATSLDTLRNKSPIGIDIHTNFTYTGNDPTIPGKNAGGTASWQGGLTWVGERGPELLFLPKGTGIMDSASSIRALTRIAQLAERPVARQAVGYRSGGADVNGDEMSSAHARSMALALEVDGQVLTKTVELHQRENRIRLGRRR